MNSLGGSSSLSVDSNPPLIFNLEIVTPYTNRIFTAGDIIDLKMTFTTDVTVFGQPILWLANSVSPLGSTVYNAPAFPAFSFVNSKPGMISQIVINIVFNWNIFVGDKVLLYLPGFFTRYVLLPFVIFILISMFYLFYLDF